MWADRDGSRSGEQALVDISPGVYVCSTQGTDHPVVLHPVRGSPSRPPPPPVPSAAPRLAASPFRLRKHLLHAGAWLGRVERVHVCMCVTVMWTEAGSLRDSKGSRGAWLRGWEGSRAGRTLTDGLPLEPTLRQLFISFPPHRPILPP